MSDNRPTKEQLQTALAAAEQSRPPRYVAVIAAEVRALQAELKTQYDDAEGWNQRALAAEATIARVEALPAKWREDHAVEGGEPAFDCADDLEAALRGEP